MPSLASRYLIAAAAVDDHCLVSSHVTASAEVAVRLWEIQVAENYEGIEQRVMTIFQELMGGQKGGAEQREWSSNWISLLVAHA
jgi:hypothetical protein